MARPEKLTDDQRRRIVKAYMSGEPSKEVAARFGCDPSYVSLLAKRSGANVSRIVRNRMAPTDVAPSASEGRAAIPLTDTYSIQPYVVKVPNRTALVSIFQTEKASFHLVSLPLLSIQRGAA